MQIEILYTLFFLIFLFIVFVLIRLRTKYIRKKNKELELLIDDKTSELKETIKKIRITKKNLRTKIYQQKKFPHCWNLHNPILMNKLH